MRVGGFLLGMLVGAALGSVTTAFVIAPREGAAPWMQEMSRPRARTVASTRAADDGRATADDATGATTGAAAPPVRATSPRREHVGAAPRSRSELLRDLRGASRRGSSSEPLAVETVGELLERFPDTEFPWRLVLDLVWSAPPTWATEERKRQAADRRHAAKLAFATLSPSSLHALLEAGLEAGLPPPPPGAWPNSAHKAVARLAEHGGVRWPTAWRLLTAAHGTVGRVGVLAVTSADAIDLPALIEASDSHPDRTVRVNVRRALSALASAGRVDDVALVAAALGRAVREDPDAWAREQALVELAERGAAGAPVALELFEAGGLDWGIGVTVARVLLQSGEAGTALARRPNVEGLEILVSGLGQPSRIDPSDGSVAVTLRTFVDPVLARHTDLLERLGDDGARRLLAWAAHAGAAERVAAIVLDRSVSGPLRYAALEELASPDESAARAFAVALRVLNERLEPATLRTLAVSILDSDYSDIPQPGPPSRTAIRAAIDAAATGDPNQWVRAAADAARRPD